jgi:hypothetical protein
MTQEFITYEQALALKELGFDEPCFRWYDERWGDDLQQDKFNTNKDLFMTDLDCSAPLYQQVFRWFREKYELEGVIEQANDYTWYKFSVYQKSNFYTSEGWKVLKSKGLKYNTYEEAEQAALDKLIEICKNK